MTSILPDVLMRDLPAGGSLVLSLLPIVMLILLLFGREVLQLLGDTRTKIGVRTVDALIAPIMLMSTSILLARVLRIMGVI